MEVKFHLPGLRRNYPLNMMVFSLLKEHPEFFREGVQIGSFFGEFPTSLWNGGRNSRADQCSADYVNIVIKSMNDRGIPVRFTYTNMLLDEKDLEDTYCNYCVEAAHKRDERGYSCIAGFRKVYTQELSEDEDYQFHL